MKHSRGFTLAEAVIGMLILSVFIVGAMSFFVFQSSRGAQSFRKKNTDETIASALNLISLDLQKAGLGVVRLPQLALFVRNGASGGADELYVSFADYLSLEGEIRAPDTDPLSVAYRSINSVFRDETPDRTYTAGTETVKYQGSITLATASEFMLRAIPAMNSVANVGGIITTGGVAADVDVKAATSVDGPIPGTKNWTFPLVSPGKTSAGATVTLAAGMVIVPAVSYKLVAAGGSRPTRSLWRNRGKETDPAGDPLVGGDAFLDVTNFQVRCAFLNPTTGVESWDTTNSQPANLRKVEVTISYRVNLGKGDQINWSSEYQRRIIVSPRSVVIAQRG